MDCCILFIRYIKLKIKYKKLKKCWKLLKSLILNKIIIIKKIKGISYNTNKKNSQILIVLVNILKLNKDNKMDSMYMKYSLINKKIKKNKSR